MADDYPEHHLGQVDTVLYDAFRQLAQREEVEFDMACLVGQVIDADFSRAQADAEIDRLIDRVEPSGSYDLSFIQDVFRRGGFNQQSPPIADMSHSNLQWVLAQRQGIPISLAVILICIARRLRVPAYGINFPGHFLVSLAGEVVDPISCDVLAANRKQVVLSERSLGPASATMIGLRMLNNLKGLSYAAGQWLEALRLLAYQMALASDAEIASTVHYERAEVWLNLGVTEMAREAYLACAECDADNKLTAQAKKRAAALGAAPQIMH